MSAIHSAPRAANTQPSQEKPPRNPGLRVYFWMLSYLKPYRGRLALLIAAGLVVSVSEMWQLKTLQLFIDHALNTSDSRMFVILLIVYTAVLALMFTAMAARNLLERIIREHAAKDIQETAFAHLRKLGFSYYERHPSGETLSLMNVDVAAMQEMYRTHLPFLVNSTLLLIVTAGFVLSISPLLVLYTVPCYLLYYLIGPFIDRKVTHWGRQRAERMGTWNKKLYDSLTGLGELRAYGQERWGRQGMLDSLRSLSNSILNVLFFMGLRDLIRRSSSLIGLAVLYFAASHMHRAGTLTTGEFVAFSLYYVFMMTASANVITAMIQQRLLIFQGERIMTFMKTRPDVVESDEPVELPQPARGEIEFVGVRFGYPEGPPVLDGFELRAKPGERIAIVGTSGNGKSTLLKLLGRFYDPQEGEIRLDGIPIHRLRLDRLREAVGFVFQENLLFGASVRDNIRFGRPDASDPEIEQAAQAACAHGFIMELPQGYDTEVGERGINLSGGQKQRIAIARMLIKNPRIVLLDEATSALDTASESEVQTALDALLSGRTTFAVAHRLSTVRNYDRIVVVEQGKAGEIGTYDELMERKGLLYKLVQMGERSGQSVAVGEGRIHDKRGE